MERNISPPLTRRGFVAALLASSLTLQTSRGSFAAEAAADYIPKEGENHVGFRRSTLEYMGSDSKDRKREVLIWYPSAVAAAKHSYRGQIGYVKPEAAVAAGQHPLILFSHGYLGAPDQSIFFTEGLARRGYIVAAIAHADGLLQKRDKPLADPKFGDAKSWNEDKFRDRREDVVALLDRLLQRNSEAGSDWHGHIDAKAIGVSGHSLGGYTALGLVGGWEKSREKRIQAAVALSPYTLPYHAQGNIADVKTPVMFQGGTFDWGITPFIPPVYKKLAGPKYSLVLKNETHFGWTNLIALGKTTTEAVAGGNAQLMLDYSVAFFDRHLCGKKDVPLLDEQNARLHSYEFAVK